MSRRILPVAMVLTSRAGSPDDPSARLSMNGVAAASIPYGPRQSTPITSEYVCAVTASGRSIPARDRHPQPLSGAGRDPRMSGNCELGRGLRRREKNATAAGAGRFEKPAPDARAAPPEAHESLIGPKTVEEVPLLTGLSMLLGRVRCLEGRGGLADPR